MKIIAFYSFKGGVGRTSALLNVGYLLATEERATVVLADWDIHAPGLTCLEDLQPADDKPRLRPGVVDVLASLAEATPEGDVLDPGGLVHSTRIGKRVAEKSGGELWLVPAGAFDPAEEQAAYLNAVRRLQPQIQDLAKAGKDDLVEWFGDRVAAGFKEQTGKSLDYLLLDARTGLTEVGDLLLSDATDQVVVVFGLNKQNQLGMEQTLRQLIERFSAANVASRAVLVASPVPAGEEAIKARRLAAAQELITRVVEELTRKASEGDPNPIAPAPPRLLKIPYHPLLALEEAMIAEEFPESDPGRAYVALKEAVRLGGKGDLAGPKAIVTTAAERLQEKPMIMSREGGRGENPFARPLRWNVVDPNATADSLAGSVLEPLREPLLHGLANSVSFTPEDRGRILDLLSSSSVVKVEDLVRNLQEEQRRWRALEAGQWAWLAERAGRSWVDWALLSAGRLGVMREYATRRLLEDWPCRVEGKVGTQAALAAIDELLSRGVISRDTYRTFLSRLVNANPSLDLALGVTAALLIELGDNDSAKALFEKAVGVSPSEMAAFLGQDIHQVASRLILKRKADALGLLEEACKHYARSLTIKPDDEGTEINWGVALAEQADALAQDKEDQALALWEQAIQHFERALAIKPDMYEAENNWGSTLINKANVLVRHDKKEEAISLWEQAIQHFANALTIKPGAYEVENNWGNALTKQANAIAPLDLDRALTLWEQAAQHFARAVAIKPDYYVAESNWGFALNNQAKVIAPQNLEKAFTLWEQANQHYSRALAIKSDMYEAENNWGAALVNQADALAARDEATALSLLEQATQHSTRALTLKPDDPKYLENLVGCETRQYNAMFRAGRNAEAQAAAARALEVAERHRVVTGKPSYNLACALSINGRIDEALDLLEALQRSGELKIDIKHLSSDPDLTPLAEHSRFKALLERLRSGE